MVAHRQGIATVPLNTNGHEEVPRDPDGTPDCSSGLRMHPTYQFQHTNGYRAQRFRCPLLFPQPTGQTCEHAQFAKAKGCVKDPYVWVVRPQPQVSIAQSRPAPLQPRR
jgi:hypothetical protein